MNPGRAPGSTNLVLIPTPLERRGIDEAGGFPAGTALVELCGFGPVAAAARAAHHLATLRPARVVLVGIAGTYAVTEQAIGSAVAFDRVSIDGVGAGGGSSILTPRMLGLPQWDGEDHSLTVFESLALAPDRAPSAPVPGQGAIGLLTVCAASGSRAEASARCERHPFARAEDMEGFGVALACAIARIPLSIVRGISNVAGERDVSRWQIGAALGAARQLALDHLGAREAPSGTSR